MADVHSKETRSYNMSRIKGKDKAWNAALVFRSSRCLFFLLLRQKKETKKRRFSSKGSAGKKRALLCYRSSPGPCMALVLTLHSATIWLRQSCGLDSSIGLLNRLTPKRRHQVLSFIATIVSCFSFYYPRLCEVRSNLTIRKFA